MKGGCKGKDEDDYLDKGKRKHKEMRDGIIGEDTEQHWKQQKLYNNPMANFVDAV